MAWGDVGLRRLATTGFPEDRRRAYELRPHPAIGSQVFRASASSPSAQFKRSALPNGPKVSAGGALSPRGDWRAPSDGNARLWMEDLERNVPEA